MSCTRTNMNRLRNTAMNPYTSATPSSAKAVPRSLLDSSGNGSDGVNTVHRALLKSMNQRPHCRLVWAAMKAITTRGPISPAAGNESGELGPRMTRMPMMATAAARPQSTMFNRTSCRWSTDGCS